jgi:ATP-dependent 26S proteasome regulatory subunit
MSILLSASRKITYSKSDMEQCDKDVAVMNKCRYSDNVKYVIINDCVYRTIVNPTMVDSDYSKPEYIVRNNGSKQHYEYQSVIELDDDVPIVKEVEITAVSSDDMQYCTKEELVADLEEMITKGLMLNKCIFANSTGTVHNVDDMDVTFKLSVDCESCLNSHYPIRKINESTIIKISPSVKCSFVVNEIIDITHDDVIDVKIECSKSVSKSGSAELDYITSQLQSLSEMMNCKSTQTVSCILKESLKDKIFEAMREDIFKLDTTFNVTCDDISFNVSIISTNLGKSNSAYRLGNETKCNLNIRNKLSKASTMLLDGIVTLEESDELTFEISTSDLNTLQYDEVVSQLLQACKKQFFAAFAAYDIYIGTAKVLLNISDVFIKRNMPIGTYGFRIRNVCPKITIKDNINSGIFVLSTQEKYVIESITFKPTKNKQCSSDSMNDIMSAMYGMIEISEIRKADVVKYFTQKIRECCMYFGRSFIFGGITYTVQKITYTDPDVKQNSHVIGIFDERSNIELCKSVLDKNISIIDDVCSTSRNIDIELVKTLSHKMEQEGMYGMEGYVERVIREVLITRTNVVDESIIDLIEPSKGIMLHGPPGTGKTTFARNLGRILGCTGSKLKFLTSTEIKSKWHGGSEGNIRKLFEKAVNSYELLGDLSPLHILVIDEIDAILGKRSEDINSDVNNSTVNQFLGEMDGLRQYSNIVVIGITNRIHSIDEAALRSGRFGCKIEIGRPNESQLKLIYESYHRKLLKAGVITNDFVYDDIVQLSKGYTGADVKRIFNLCMSAYVNNKMMGEPKLITFADILNAITQP